MGKKGRIVAAKLGVVGGADFTTAQPIYIYGWTIRFLDGIPYYVSHKYSLVSKGTCSTKALLTKEGIILMGGCQKYYGRDRRSLDDLRADLLNLIEKEEDWGEGDRAFVTPVKVWGVLIDGEIIPFDDVYEGEINDINKKCKE